MNKCRGTLRIRSSTRRSIMPCSCKRCTKRSRVRAEVMPIPLRRGPSMKLLKLEPLLQFGQSGMSRQIDLQGSDGRKAFRHGMKIRAWSGVLAGAGVAHPVDIAAPRIFRLHDRLAAVAAAKPRHLDAPQLTIGEIRHIDVEDDGSRIRTRQPVSRHLLHQLRRHLRGSGEVARASRLDAEPHRNGRYALRTSMSP